MLPLRVNEYQSQNITNASKYNLPFYFFYLAQNCHSRLYENFGSLSRCSIKTTLWFSELQKVLLTVWNPTSVFSKLLSASEFQLLISSSKRQHVGLLIFDPSFPWLGKILWRRKWQPTPVFLPGESHGWRTLVGYSPRGHKESDMTERLHFHFSFHDCVSFHGERQCVCSYLY